MPAFPSTRPRAARAAVRPGFSGERWVCITTYGNSSVGGLAKNRLHQCGEAMWARRWGPPRRGAVWLAMMASPSSVTGEPTMRWPHGSSKRVLFDHARPSTRQNGSLCCRTNSTVRARITELEATFDGGSAVGPQAASPADGGVSAGLVRTRSGQGASGPGRGWGSVTARRRGAQRSSRSPEQVSARRHPWRSFQGRRLIRRCSVAAPEVTRPRSQ